MSLQIEINDATGVIGALSIIDTNGVIDPIRFHWRLQLWKTQRKELAPFKLHQRQPIVIATGADGEGHWGQW